MPIASLVPNESLSAANVCVVDSIGEERTETSTPEVIVWATQFVPVVNDWKFVTIFVVPIPFLLIQKIHSLTLYFARRLCNI